jgi:hypothetical protein
MPDPSETFARTETAGQVVDANNAQRSLCRLRQRLFEIAHAAESELIDWAGGSDDGDALALERPASLRACLSMCTPLGQR